MRLPVFNMGGTIFLFYKSTRPLQIRPLTAYLYKPFKRYSQSKKSTDHVIDERAPSTADEFKRVAEEKVAAEEHAQVGDQGVASQTIEKAYDGTKEATIGDSKIESVKNRYKEHKEGPNYRKTGD